MKKKQEKEKKVSKNKKDIAAAAILSETLRVTAANHKQAAEHHKAAAEYHMEAAKEYEAGNHEKGAYYSLLAHGHHMLAGQFISDDAKHHAQQLKQTNYHH